MPRLRQVPRAEADQKVAVPMYDQLFGTRDPVAEPGTATGTPGNWWTVFALVPDVLDHAVRGFGLYRSERALAPQLRELGMTRAGYGVGSQFVFSQHCKAARAVGVREEQIAAIPSWPVHDCWTPLERAVLAYADCLVLEGGRVPEPTFEALRAHLSDEAILELTYTTALYAMHATMARALRLEYDDRDEPVVEIPAPGGGAARDVMGDIAR
jgi:alkylhydroperoxidase family enzyme